MLLRVGIDSTTGGFVAPLFKDGTFEYIPIPDHKEDTSETKNYDSFKKYVPEDKFYFKDKKEEWEWSYNETVQHNDPNFESKTYGDPTNKGKNLLKLKKGDYLVFWEAFYPFIRGYNSNKLADIQKVQNQHYKVMAVIGYFKLVEDPIKCWEKDTKDIKNKFKENAHILRKQYEKNTIIINGNCSESKKLLKAIPLAQKYDKTTKGYVGLDYLKKFGLNNKRFQQSSDIHFLEESKTEKFIVFLNTNPDENKILLDKFIKKKLKNEKVCIQKR